MQIAKKTEPIKGFRKANSSAEAEGFRTSSVSEVKPSNEAKTSESRVAFAG